MIGFCIFCGGEVKIENSFPDIVINIVVLLGVVMVSI